MDGGSYPMQDKSRQVQGGHMPSAPPNYVANVHQAAGGIIQAPVIPYNNEHVEQPSGDTVVLIPSQATYISDYMSLSICTCLCCFPPVGIVAIVLSCMVCLSRRGGDLEGAKIFSKWANYLSSFSIILGVITYIAVINHLVVNSNSSGEN